MRPRPWHTSDSDLVATEAVRAPPAELVDLGVGNGRCDGAHDALRQILLDGEDILKHAVVSLRPDMAAAQGVDELAGHSSIGCLADAAFNT